MKRMVWLLLQIVISNMALNAQIEGTVQWESKDFTYQIAGEYTEIVSESGYIEMEGAPQMPYCIKTFLVPINAQVSVQVASVNKKLLDENILLYPYQPPIPIGRESLAWVKPDDAIYNSLNPFPGKYAEIISDREDFGYHLVTVRFYPLEYIPKKRELYRCDIAFSLTYPTVRTSVSLSTVEKQSEYLNRLDKDYIRSIIENKEMLADIAPNIKQLVRKGDIIDDGAALRSSQTSIIREQLPEYLIITNDALKETFQLLADWKTKKGIPAIVETVEKIDATYPGSDLQEKIRNYLVHVRRTYGYLFVLLGGDTNIIPARVRKSKDTDTKNWVAVDFYYACIERGNWNANGNNEYFESVDYDDEKDWGWSFKLGRASVENEVEAELFVKKVLHYEKADVDIDYSYINNSMAADAFIDKDDSTGILSISGRGDIMGYYDKTGLNRWLIYDHYNCNSKTPICNGRHGDVVVDPSGRGEELNKANFLAALQNGGNSGLNHFHLIYHMDHSGYLNMGTSQKDKNEMMTILDVDNLDNGNYSHILMSGGCSPADITKDCIAEHFITNLNGGTVAFIGNTDAGYSSEHAQFDRFLRELYKIGIGVTNRYDLSILYQKAIAYKSINVGNCRLHLFGDPEMQVWTTAPKTLNATITPVSLQTGKNVLTVAINGLSQNETARICIQKGDELYIVEQLGNGTHTMNAFIQTVGTVTVTITAHNFKPLEKDMPVLQVGSAPTAALADLIYKDNRTGASIGNGDGQLDAGETIELTVKLRNTGSSALNNVTASLTSRSDDVEIVTGQTSFGNISGSAIATSKTPYVFKINSHSEEHLKNGSNAISLKLEISVGGDTKTELFKIEDVYAPGIQIGNQKVTWSTNGNTTVEPGETVKMNIDLTSLCKSEVTGLKAVLVSNNAQVSCSSTPVAYPDIPAFEAKTNAIAFQFQTSSTYVGPLNFTLNVSNEYGKTWSFPVNPLSRPATINVSTISSQPYHSSINIYWQPVTGVAGYHIYRSNNGENGTYQRLNKFLLTAAYYLDESLSECTTYHYKVVAVSANGNESGWSMAYRTWTSYPAVSPFPLRLTTGTYQTESCPNVADVDNDGKQEIFGICGDRDAYTSYLVGFRPTGEELYNIDNNVTTVSGFAKMMTLSAGQVAFGDLYGKGEQNIVVSTWNNKQREKNGVSCYSAFDRNGDQRPDLLWETKIPYSSHQSPVVANLDGSIDGSMEVIVKSHQTSDIYILDNNGNELRRLNPKTYGYNDANYSNLTVADLDDDGQMEIIVSYDVLGIYIWRQDGTPFTENPFWGAGIARLASAPVVCDLNEDGKKELVFSQNNIAISHIYAISLDGDKAVAGWNGEQAIPYTDNDAALDHTLSVGDINNDGHLEVVILGHDVMKVWKHTGELLFSKEIRGLCPNIAYAGNSNTSILADVDGDAVPDIVFCSGRYIYAVHSDGSDIIGFPIIADGDFQDTPCVADIDGDGKNELIANNSYDLYVWKTNGLPGSIEWGTRRGNPQNTGEYFPTACEPMIIVGDKIWDGESPCGNVVVQSGKFVIPAGKTMTLSAASALIIRAGGTLEVDGGMIREANIKALDGSSVMIKNNGCIQLKKNTGFLIEKGAQLDYQSGKIDLAD